MTQESQIASLLSAVATLTDEVSGLKREVASLAIKVNESKEIVEAWQAVKTGGKFLKWIGGIVAAVAAIIVATKTGLAHMIGGIR